MSTQEISRRILKRHFKKAEEEEEDLKLFHEDLRKISERVLNDLRKNLDSLEEILNSGEKDITSWDKPSGRGPLASAVREIIQMENSISKLTQMIWGQPFYKMRHL